MGLFSTAVEALKSIINWLISPLIVGLIFQTLGWSLWRTPQKKRAMFLLLAGFVILVVGSLPVLSHASNRNREFVYPPLDTSSGLVSTRPVLVYVLGTGFNPDPLLPASSQVSGTFLARLLEGVRIYRSRPGVRLVVSVANEDADPEDKQTFLNAMAAILSIDPKRVDLITDAQSTDDEARLLKGHLKDSEQLVLATSASHMPRAMAIFKAAGTHPTAAPADFQYPRAGGPGDKLWKQWVPSADGLGGNHQMLYESLAALWGMVKD